MSIIELIKERKSVRSYTGEPLSKEHVDSINNYIEQLDLPFGTKARIQLIRAKTGDQPVKLGTYGVISGATDFLSKMGNAIETECLLFYAEIGILATRHSKAETDIRIDY